MANPSWYASAFKELGTKEIAGPGHNPAVDKYFGATGVPKFNDNESWCAAFIAWNMKTNGIEYNKATAAGALSWLNWGKAIKVPKVIDSKYDVPVGAVGVINRGAPGSGHGHVFMFSSWADENHSVALVLEGNSEDMVRIGTIATSAVLGWRWPTEIPIPTSSRPAINNGIIKAAGVAVAGGATEIAANSGEIIDAVQKAKSISQGSIIGAVVGALIVVAVVTVIILRYKQKSDTVKIATPQ